MKRWIGWHGMGKLAVALGAAVLLAIPAHAQSVFVGHFTLPCETNWAGAELPAGDYTMTLPFLHARQFVRVQAVRGHAAGYFSTWSSGEKFSGKNMLVLTRIGSRCIVRALNLADLNMAITYKPIGREEEVLRRGSKARLVALLVTKH